MTDITKHVFQCIALILVFGAKVVEKWRSKGSDLEKVKAERLYWGILMLGLVIALTLEIYAAYDKRVTEERAAYDNRVYKAIQRASEAALDLDQIIDRVKVNPQELPALEMSVYELANARTDLLRYSERVEAAGPLIRATQVLGVGQERLAYGDRQKGRRYYLSNRQLQSCEIPTGSKMGRYASKMNWAGVIRCTDIDKDPLWKKTNETIDELATLIEHTRSNPSAGQEAKSKIPQAARTVGYFYLCDYLRNKRVESLARAQKAWKLFEETTAGNKITMQNLYQEMAEKIAVLEAIAALPAPTHPTLLSEVRCPARMD